MRLFQLIEEHRKGIAFIALLIIVENVAWIAEPTLFGNLIDAFLKRAAPRFFPDKSAHIFSVNILDHRIPDQFRKRNIAP